jgi:uncharacterized protein YjgD (DUF1641 family)
MAEPIPLNIPPRDPREALYRRLENAPQEHVEAMLAAYDLLQGLHDRGALELLKGALGSSDKVLQILIDAGNTPEMIRGIRNLMILAKIFEGIEPELLEGIERAALESLAAAKSAEPLGFLELLKKLFSRDTRRVVTMIACLLESFGKSLVSKKPRAR